MTFANHYFGLCCPLWHSILFFKNIFYEYVGGRIRVLEECVPQIYIIITVNAFQSFV